MTVNYDREQFRKYLQDTGAVSALSRVFLKLYELKENRPKSAIKFIVDHVYDKAPSLIEYETLKDDLNALGVLLADLKTNGQLSARHLAVIEQICAKASIPIIPDGCKPESQFIVGRSQEGPSDAVGQTQVEETIAVRRSQLVDGNEVKTSNESTCKIRQLDSKAPDYDAKIAKALDALIKNKKCNSLLRMALIANAHASYLTAKRDVLVECISSGLDMHESMIGVYAAAKEAYTALPDLFKPIILAYHGFDVTGTDKTAVPGQWGDPTDFKEIDRKQKYILSTRIRCIRNVVDNVATPTKYPLVPNMTADQLKELCGIIEGIFKTNFTDDLKGTWYEISKLSTKTKQGLIDNGYILEYGDKFLESAGCTEHWPEGRAVYINDKKTFFVWINEEDHLRFISMEAGSNIEVVYDRLKRALECFSAALTNLKPPLVELINTDFGCVTLCPTNLGNTIRASVMIKLPKLAGTKTFQTLVDNLKLEIRGSPGPDNSGAFEISNKRKLGKDLTEHASIKEFYDGIKELIEEEKKSA